MHARLLHEESSSNPRISIARMPQTRLCRGDRQYSLPAPVRRPNTDERRACQADPADLVYSDGRRHLRTIAAARMPHRLRPAHGLPSGNALACTIGLTCRATALRSGQRAPASRVFAATSICAAAARDPFRKSSRSVVPACRSMPSGSQPVQRQSAGVRAEQPRGIEVHRLAMIGIHMLDRALLGFQQRAGIGNIGQKLLRLEVDDPAKTGDQMRACGRIRKNEKSLKSTKTSADGWALR